MVSEISSLQHPLVKKWVKLRCEKGTRIEENCVLLIGEKMIRDLSKNIVFEALITKKETKEIPALQYYVVSSEVLHKITALSTTDGFAAVAKMPSPSSLSGKQRILLLDRISDPGNLGTLLRSCLALGWDGVFFTHQTVDPFNDKALRASKGAIFSLPFSWGDGAAFIQKERLHAYVADLEGKALSEMQIERPFVLILSNEGEGVSRWTEKIAQKICIPMQNGVDSLNVAASGAIFLYMMRL